MILVKRICFILLFNSLLYGISFGFMIERDKIVIMLQRLGNILDKCTSQMVDRTGVVSHSKSYSNWPIAFKNITIINLKEIENSEEFGAVSVPATHKRQEKLHTFIILTPSTNNFQRLIDKLKKTVFWNAFAQYLIVDDRAEITGCKNAVTFLNISWMEDLLYSTYFCVEPKQGFTMYTYNPYSRRAPNLWKEVGQYTFNNHVGSLFTQKLIPGQTTCQDFTFEKTIVIDDYPIKAFAVHAGYTLNISRNETGLQSVGGPEGIIIKTALMKMNPALNLSVVRNGSNWDKHFIALRNGMYDIILNARYIYNKTNVLMTYPHDISGVSLMTQHPEYEKPYVRILTRMNPKVIGLVFLVFMASSVIFSICTAKGLIHSTLEAIRLLLGTSTLRSPRRTPLRIYLITVTLLFMLTNSVFQSSLSSLLTIPVHKPYINEPDDLRDHPDFLIYISHRLKRTIGEDWMASQIRTINQTPCTEYVKQNPLAACAADRKYLITEADRESLHVTRFPLVIQYMTYIVRPNWPLHERLSSILRTLTEAGIVQFLRDRLLLNIIQRRTYMEKEQSSKSVYHAMVLSDLMFAFYILLFGLCFATIVFFFELYKSRPEKFV